MSCLEALAEPRPTTPPGCKIILVSAALLVNPEKEVLIARRPEGKSLSGLWEFPGGKVEQGETPEFTLTRELHEELGIETRECCFTPIGFASHSYESFHLLMPLYACRMWEGEPQALEHSALAWVRPNDLPKYEMPPADIPLIHQIQDRL